MASRLGKHADRALSKMKSALKESGATLTVRGGGREFVIGGEAAPAPTTPPVAQQQGFGFDTTMGFLGEEFLLWLWWQIETEGGEWLLLLGREVTVGVFIDDLLAFAPNHDDETEQTLRHGSPTRTAEARTALRHGHRVARARLIIAAPPGQWAVTLNGATMTLSGVSLPEDAEECESAEDRTQDRAASWLMLQRIIEQLFSRFVNRRAGPGWAAEAAQIAEWMAQ